MTPALQTLAVEAGLARGFAVIAPDRAGAGLWKVLVDVGLAGDGDYPLHHVGAYDLRRRAALERGAGEAVERFALAQDAEPDVWEAPAALSGGPTPAVWPRWVDGDDFRSTPRGWYRGVRLSDSQPVLVPDAAIDDHAGRRRDTAVERDFDPSPSGAAAGTDGDAAARAALLEIVERDAVLCAWATGVGMTRIEAEAAVVPHRTAGDGIGDPVGAGLLAALADVGLRPVFGRLSTAVPGVQVHCCAIIGRSTAGIAVGFGSKASASPASATRGALQEALQIHELLGNLRTHHSRPAVFDVARPDPSCVVDDVSRAWWWTTETAAASMEDWIASWCEPAGDGEAGEAAALADIMTHVARDGGEPILVDLGHRLPPAVRALGWHAVKVVCPGYQQLRLDETLAATWDRSRLATWAARHGAVAGEPSSLPHPLI